MNLELEKKKLQVVKANAAIAELEFKKLEMLDNMKRIEDHIEKQKASIVELEKEIKEI